MKYRIEIEERISYSHTAEIECDYERGELELILDETENDIQHHRDIIVELEANGIKVITFDEDEDGNYDDFEFADIEELKE